MDGMRKNVIENTQAADMEPMTDEDEADYTIVQEFGFFLREYKKWWLVPLILMFIGLGLLVAMQTTPLGPFIYSLF